MLRIDQVPKIEVHVVKSGEPPGGIGETGANAGPPALRNAIYGATGVALRRLPIDRAMIAAGEKACAPPRAAFWAALWRFWRSCCGEAAGAYAGPAQWL